VRQIGWRHPPASLDAPIGDDDSNNFSDVVEDESATSPYENLKDKTVIGMLQDMVTHLDPREATILRFRFGLDGARKNAGGSRPEIRVTRERVRQIQNLALRKLRKMIENLKLQTQGKLTPCPRRHAPGNRIGHPQRPRFPKAGIQFKTSRPCCDARLFFGATSCSRKNSSPVRWTRSWH